MSTSVFLFLLISVPLNDGFIILDGPGDDNVAADRFLIVCGVDTIYKKNDGSRKSTDSGSELLNTEIEYLFRVDVGHSLDSTIQVPIAAFEEYCPGNGSGSGEHSMEEHVPTDILNIQEQWKLFSVSFPYEVSIEKIRAEIKTGSAYESKAGGGREAAAPALIAVIVVGAVHRVAVFRIVGHQHH